MKNSADRPTDRTLGSLATALAIPLMTVLAVGCVRAPEEEGGGEKKAIAGIYDATANKIGTIYFTQDGDGPVEVEISLSDVPNGEHGVHVHETGECVGPDFKSAKGHWNPTAMMHGGPESAEHHAGDLGKVIVSGRRGESKLTTDHLSLADGDLSIMGRAVIVHADPDDLTTQMPPGNAGARIGCGVIRADDGGQDILPTPGDPPEVPPNATVDVSGRLFELGAFFAGGGMLTGASAVGGASMSTIGLNPEAQTIANDVEATRGEFRLTLPQNGKTLVHVQKAGYFPTYSEITTSASNITNKRIYVAAAPYISAIASTHTVDLDNPIPCTGGAPDDRCIYGIIIGQIIDDGTAGNGTPYPVEGIEKADITIAAAGGAPAQLKGPYFLTATGEPSADLLTTARQGLFVAFVEIPAVTGPVTTDFQISVAYDDAGTIRYFGPTPVKAHRPYGVSWIYVRETGRPADMPMGGGGGGGGGQENIDFDTQIYPLFSSIREGGFGCRGCHTSAAGAAPAAGLDLSGGPEAAYALLNPETYPERVNVMMPSESLLLTKPLYENDGPQNHPIYAFTTVEDAAYKLIKTWIREGGRRETPVPPPPVSFAADILPLLANTSTAGGLACDVCHALIEPPEGGFDVRGGAELLHAELTREAPTDDGLTGEPYRVNLLDPAKSLLLTNLLVDNPEPHPTKLFPSNADPRYQLIYRWIVEGALNN